MDSIDSNTRIPPQLLARWMKLDAEDPIEVESQEEHEDFLIEQAQEARTRGTRYLSWFMEYMRRQAQDPRIEAYSRVLNETDDWIESDKTREAVRFFYVWSQNLPQLISKIMILVNIRIPELGTEDNYNSDGIQELEFLLAQIGASEVDTSQAPYTWSLESEQKQFDRGILTLLQDIAVQHRTRASQMTTSCLKRLSEVSYLEQLDPDIQKSIISFFRHDIIGTKLLVMMCNATQLMVEKEKHLNNVVFQKQLRESIRQLLSLDTRISPQDKEQASEMTLLDLQETLIVALEEMKEQYGHASHGYTIEYNLAEVSDDTRKCGLLREIVFTILNDSFHNADRAGAKKLGVSSRVTDTEFILYISDDGDGFPASEVALQPTEIAGESIYPFEIELGKTFSQKDGYAGTGVGLATLKQYLESSVVGGSVTVGNKIDEPGALVIIQVPLSGNDATP